MSEQNDIVVSLFGTKYAASSLSNQTKTLFNNFKRLEKDQIDRRNILQEHRSLLIEYESLIKNSVEGVEPLPEVEEQPAEEPIEEEKQDE
jgi:hypothetical protein